MAKEISNQEIGEMLTYIVQNMATKDDIAEIHGILDEHTAILDEHTRILGNHDRRFDDIENKVVLMSKDLERNLDKRMQLEVRVVRLEKEVLA